MRLALQALAGGRRCRPSVALTPVAYTIATDSKLASRADDASFTHWNCW
jgi:hypothetical protein